MPARAAIRAERAHHAELVQPPQERLLHFEHGRHLPNREDRPVLVFEWQRWHGSLHTYATGPGRQCQPGPGERTCVQVVNQAAIGFVSPVRISTLRGRAFSASGTRTVSTPSW